MPAFNQNVYNRMLARGKDMSDPRIQRRLANRSFQANQGTLKKGSWTNQEQMQQVNQPQPQQGYPSQAQPPAGGYRPYIQNPNNVQMPGVPRPSGKNPNASGGKMGGKM